MTTNWRQAITDKKAAINTYLVDHRIAVKAVFVPWSQSRNRGEKDLTLNWKVTITKDDREVLHTDYSAGCGHCPGYKAKYYARDIVKWECEHGKAGRYLESIGSVSGNNPILPDSLDVIYSLVMDSDVMDYSTFEDWAGELGYDEDSREAERIYRACLEIGLKMRNGLGDKVLSELRELYQDY